MYKIVIFKLHPNFRKSESDIWVATMVDENNIDDIKESSEEDSPMEIIDLPPDISKACKDFSEVGGILADSLFATDGENEVYFEGGNLLIDGPLTILLRHFKSHPKK